MPNAQTERGIIRRLKRRLLKHPKSRVLFKALRRHRAAYRAANPTLRMRAYREAEKLIGVMEYGGNNSGAQVAAIIRASYGDPAGRPPWCGYTMGTCYRRAGSKLVDWRWGAVRLIGLIAGVRKTSNPKCGDLVRYTFDHVGMFVKDNGNGTITTIEGNTGPSGAVSDSKTGGDGVYRKIRDKALVQDYLRVTR